MESKNDDQMKVYHDIDLHKVKYLVRALLLERNFVKGVYYQEWFAEFVVNILLHPRMYVCI